MRTDNSWMAFGKEWFDKHQKKILWCLNTPIIKHVARWILRIHRDCPTAEIIDIKPNCYTIKGEKPGEYKTDFRCHWKFAKRVYFAFKPMWWIMHTWDEIFADKHAPQLSFGFDTLTAYPDAGKGNTTCDGYAGRYAAGSFSAIRGGAGNTNGATEGTLYPYLKGNNTSNSYIFMIRPVAIFDTSALTSDATISSVVFSGYGTDKSNGLGSPDCHIAGATTVADNATNNADYQNVGRTSFGSVTYAGFSTVAYNDFTLNASGIANVSKTGNSRFSMQLSWDILNSTTGLTWSSDAISQFSIRAADYTGTSQDPKLTVTYTLASTFTPKIIFID